MNRPTRIIVSCLAGVFAAAILALWLGPQGATAPKANQTTVAGIKIGGSFNGLLDQNGKAVRDAQFAGKYKLVFFGFTYCPSICPTELQKNVTALKTLSPSARARLTPVFITIDPARDTPAALKTYLAMFSKDIVGLTGTQAQIDTVVKDWKIYATRVQTPEMTTYTMDHSTFTYFIGPDGALIEVFRMAQGADILAETLKKTLE